MNGYQPPSFYGDQIRAWRQAQVACKEEAERFMRDCDFDVGYSATSDKWTCIVVCDAQLVCYGEGNDPTSSVEDAKSKVSSYLKEKHDVIEERCKQRDSEREHQ